MTEDVTLYRPSNGTEGEIFMGQWCARCQHDDYHDGGDGCPIIGNTMALAVDHPDYPKEWREEGPQGPRCTNFLAEGAEPPIPVHPDQMPLL